MKGIFNRNINLGIHKGLKINEEKLVKLLNFICLIWYFVTVVFIISDYFFANNYTLLLQGYLIQVLLFIVVQLLQSNRKYIAARILFILMSHLLIFVFSNLIIPGAFVDLFYILIPLFSLMFFENKLINYSFLVLAILSFIIPNIIWRNYAEELFSDPTTIPVFFISIFLLVVYFKNLNLKNEKRLLKQKNIALEDKKIIGSQKKELENINNFQNQFFVNIAHEIRTPLTIIKGNINRLNPDLSDSKILDNLKTQTNNIQRIVNDVMDLTKMDSNEFSLNLENISFSSFIFKIFNSFNSNFKNKNIDYQYYDLTNRNVIISADKIYLESAISNVIVNSLKYTDTNGKVTVVIDNIGNNLVVKIKDTGIGIEKSELVAVFNRFFQSNNTINHSGGSGIGLAFSKEIIKGHDGNITVESQIEVGSVFIISLPITSFEKEVVLEEVVEFIKKPIVPIDNKVKTANRTILLVEDNEEMREYIIDVLSLYKIVYACDGLDALEKLKNHKIDFIITDYMMPKMDGYEFVKIIKENKNTLPVLMLTAKSDVQVKLEMLRLGIDDYITKPFEEEELLLRIKNGLKNYSAQQAYIKEENLSHSKVRENSISTKFVNELKVYIEKNCTKSNFGVLDICDNFAVSQSTLYRKIKSLTGLNIKEFITEVRLQKAYQLFNQKELISLKELGYEVGFLNYAHFKKLFEQRFGKYLSN